MLAALSLRVRDSADGVVVGPGPRCGRALGPINQCSLVAMCREPNTQAWKARFATYEHRQQWVRKGKMKEAMVLLTDYSIDLVEVEIEIHELRT